MGKAKPVFKVVMIVNENAFFVFTNGIIPDLA